MAGTVNLRGILVILWTILTLVTRCAADAVDDLATVSRENVYKILNGSLSDGATHSTCTKDKLVVRREWGTLSIPERDAYIQAVLCLMSKPSKFSASVAPGAKNRYDDFVGVHIQQTMNIHLTSSFLSWHRYFTWSYENALRTECGYNGSQPYWNWAKYSDPLTSPIFDGSDHSMSGNGQAISHAGHAVGAANVVVPAGKGGGCVQTGPFKNMTVNLGPLASSTSVQIPNNPRNDGLGHNPRCLRRDISDYFTTRHLRVQDVQSLITTPTTITQFQEKMQVDTTSTFGVHSAGHFTIWGDPGGDFYSSPGDPAFWLHHGMIDRTWWIWQNQNPSSRVMTVGGSTSMFGGAAGTLNDNVNLGVVGSSYKIRDLVSTTAGPFCYVYE